MYCGHELIIGLREQVFIPSFYINRAQYKSFHHSLINLLNCAFCLLMGPFFTQSRPFSKLS